MMLIVTIVSALIILNNSNHVCSAASKPEEESETAGCSGGWHHNPTNNACYILKKESDVDFFNAAIKCAALNARLTDISSTSEQQFLKNLTENQFLHQNVWGGVWTAGTDMVQEGAWRWYMYDTVMSKTLLWSTGQPDNSNNEDCATIGVHPNVIGKLNDAKCNGNYVYGYICKRMPGDVGCNDTWLLDTRTKSCYKFEESLSSFNGAETHCRLDDGAHLASILSVQDHQFIKAIAHTVISQKMFWVGAFDSHNESDWSWTDGSPWWQGIAWDPGEPNNSNENEHCGGVYTAKKRTKTGLLNDIQCEHALPYVCKQKAKVVCPLSKDDKGLTWNETPGGNTQTNQCLEGYSGIATRTCNDNGSWQLIRYNCVREEISSLQQQISAFTNESSPDDIKKAVAEVANVTSGLVGATPEEKLTDLEIILVVNSLENIADIVQDGAKAVIVKDDFLEICSNLIDPNNKEAWITMDEENKDGAEQLISSVGKLAVALVPIIKESNSTLEVVKPNIVLEIKKYQNEDIIFPAKRSNDIGTGIWADKIKSYIRASASSLSVTAVVSTGILFKNMTNVLPVRRDNNGSKNDNSEINGPVLALTISSAPASFDTPIKIMFEHTLAGYTNPSCSFWVFSRESQTHGYWAQDGCWLVSTDEAFTECECNHLTNFAILMSPFKEGSSSTGLRVISIVGIGISLLCLFITFILHIWLWRFLRCDRVTILMNLCVALIASYIVFVAGVDRTESKVGLLLTPSGVYFLPALCTIVAALLQYLYLVVFFVMLTEGIIVGIAVLFVFVQKTRIKLLITLSWVIPGAIVGISLGVTEGEGYGNDKYCWLSIDNGLIWAFVGPALLVILLNLICLVAIIRVMCGTQTMEQKEKLDKLKASVRSLCVLIPLMGISWLIGIFYIDDAFSWIQYLFAICNGLQGFFIFLFHCALSHKVGTALQEWKRRRSSLALTSTGNTFIDGNESSKIKKHPKENPNEATRSDSRSGILYNRTSVDLQDNQIELMS